MNKEHDILKMDGYDDCISGIVTRYGMEPIICYDKEKVIDKLIKDGCSHEEAEEYFYYNQIGAWMGSGTPCFIEKYDKDIEYE